MTFFLVMCHVPLIFFFFFFNDTATTEIYTLSLHDALPIWSSGLNRTNAWVTRCPRLSWRGIAAVRKRSEEHTSELQSPCNLVCRLLLEKKKTKDISSQLNRDDTDGTHLDTHTWLSAPPIRY